MSRVQSSRRHSCTRLLDIAWNTLDELKRLEASVAAAKLMLAVVVLNTTDATKAWACLLLACPLYQDHMVDTALKAPSAVQHIAQWTVSAGPHILSTASAAAGHCCVSPPLPQLPTRHSRRRGKCCCSSPEDSKRPAEVPRQSLRQPAPPYGIERDHHSNNLRQQQPSTGETEHHLAWRSQQHQSAASGAGNTAW